MVRYRIGVGVEISYFAATARFTRDVSKRYPNLPQVLLPFVEAVEPRSIVHALAQYLDFLTLLASKKDLGLR
jgi:hypothetical protein